MDKPTTIVVMGVGKASELNSEILALIHNEHGKEVIIVSESEAKEQGIIGIPPSMPPFTLKQLPRFEPKLDYLDPHFAKNDCKKGWRK